MSQTLVSSLTMEISSTLTDTGTVTSFTIPFASATTNVPTLAHSMATGTGANKANKLYYERVTVGAASSISRDLRALTDRLGAVLTFDLVKWFIIRVVTPTTLVKVTYGGAAANQFLGWLVAAADTEDVHDVMLHINQVDGWTCDATHKDIKIANAGGAGVPIDLIIIGEDT